MSSAQLWIMVKEGLAFFFTKSPEMPTWNDENSLSWIENIGEVGLYVKGEASTRYAVLGLGYGRRSCACLPSLSLRRGGRETFRLYLSRNPIQLTVSDMEPKSSSTFPLRI